ncbi:hypothetical protein, partial [Amycolatopsis solani]|uniref:hypothetical protein n=1 Tax=Amycolatopsis solani TaxID=3028615 RepID=UPI0025B0EBDB
GDLHPDHHRAGRAPPAGSWSFRMPASAEHDGQQGQDEPDGVGLHRYRTSSPCVATTGVSCGENEQRDVISTPSTGRARAPLGHPGTPGGLVVYRRGIDAALEECGDRERFDKEFPVSANEGKGNPGITIRSSRHDRLDTGRGGDDY